MARRYTLFLQCPCEYACDSTVVSLGEGLLTFFGEQFLQSFKEPDRAIRYFEMAADGYPRSWAAWDGLGKAYIVKGDQQQARAMYEKSLLLNPQNENAKQVLQSLRGK